MNVERNGLALDDSDRSQGLAPRPPRNNNFDAIRLFAASQVLLLHSYEHLGLAGIRPIDRLVGFLGYLPGVPIFFLLSGFLISWSWNRAPTARDYVWNRVLRVFPALWAAFAVSAIALIAHGAIDSSSALSVPVLGWVLGQLTLFQFYTPEALRTYGMGTPNGSLWTIVVELQFYLLLPVLYCAARSRRALVNRLGAALIVLSILANGAIASLHEDAMLTKILKVTVAPYLFYFLVGVLAYANWKRISPWIEGKFRHWAAAFGAYVVLAGEIGGTFSPGYWLNPSGGVFYALLGGLVLSCAFSRARSQSISKLPDLSYGLYLYHCVVLNILIEAGVVGSVWALGACILATLGFAVVSWRVIERPALAHRAARVAALAA